MCVFILYYSLEKVIALNFVYLDVFKCAGYWYRKAKSDFSILKFSLKHILQTKQKLCDLWNYQRESTVHLMHKQTTFTKMLDIYW